MKNLTCVPFVVLLLVTACARQSVGGVRIADSQAVARPVAISSFEDCVKAGHPILRSLPPRCNTPDGRTFVEGQAPREDSANCKDLCGNGICEQIVCSALGCPCAETPESCPSDCVGKL